MGEGVPRRRKPGFRRPYRLPQLQTAHDEARTTSLGISCEF